MLKRFVLSFFSLAICVMSIKADLIVLTDGTTMQVHNVEVSPKWIFYTETAGEDADIKKISIDRVFGYKIGENPMTPVSGNAESPQPASTPASGAEKTGKLTPVPAADNDALIAAYNNHPALSRIGKKPEPNDYCKYFLTLWGIEQGSILSDDNIEIGFEKVYDEKSKNHKVVGSLIKVTNKTDGPIYIDLGSCYKIMNEGYSVPYYTNSVYREGAGTASGASLNMGGIAGALGIGGVLGGFAGGLSFSNSNNQNSDISTAEQRIISIPPHSKVTLPSGKYSTGKNNVELVEPFYFYNTSWPDGWISNSMKYEVSENLTVINDQKLQKVGDDPKASAKSLNVRKWMQTDFTPTNTPKKLGRIITYSTSPDFESFTSLPVNLYLRGIFGVTVTTNVDVSLRIPSYDDKNYEGIIDDEHFIVGRGYVKDK